MMKLTTGEWTNGQLAKWFGIKENTFCSQRASRFKELENYADFEVQKGTGKIIITNVKREYFLKESLKDLTLSQILERDWDNFINQNPSLSITEAMIKFWHGYPDARGLTFAYSWTRQWLDKRGDKDRNENKTVPIKYPKKQEVEKNAYIYAIQIEGEVVYIGKTCRPIEVRKAEHEDAVALKKGFYNAQQNFLYRAMRKYPYEFFILYESHGEISNFQLQCLECGYIEYYKPRYNFVGVQVPYKWDD